MAQKHVDPVDPEHWKEQEQINENKEILKKATKVADLEISNLTRIAKCQKRKSCRYPPIYRNLINIGTRSRFLNSNTYVLLVLACLVGLYDTIS